jgi:hypothetical protein
MAKVLKGVRARLKLATRIQNVPDKHTNGIAPSRKRLTNELSQSGLNSVESVSSACNNGSDQALNSYL